MRIGVIGPNPDGFSKCGFSAGLLASCQPDDAEIVVRFRHVRVEVDRLLERADGLGHFPRRPIGQTQFMPRGRILRRDGGGSLEELHGLRRLPGTSQRGPELLEPDGKFRIAPHGFAIKRQSLRQLSVVPPGLRQREIIFGALRTIARDRR